MHFVKCSDEPSIYGCKVRGNESDVEPRITLDHLAIPVMPTSDAPKSAAEIVALFAAALEAEPNTKVVAVSHVTTTHGLTFPIKAISELAHRKGALVVVDGAQAMGMSVNVTELGCDVYATSAHKWMLAPKGSGVSKRGSSEMGVGRPELWCGGGGQV